MKWQKFKKQNLIQFHGICCRKIKIKYETRAGSVDYDDDPHDQDEGSLYNKRESWSFTSTFSVGFAQMFAFEKKFFQALFFFSSRFYTNKQMTFFSMFLILFRLNCNFNKQVYIYIQLRFFLNFCFLYSAMELFFVKDTTNTIEGTKKSKTLRLQQLRILFISFDDN